MENKMSKGITIIGWLFIIGGGFSLVNLFNKNIIIFRYENYAHFIFFYSLLATPLAIVAGIFLLKLKEWARRVCIILTLVSIILTILSPYTLAENLTNNVFIVFYHIAIGMLIALSIICYLTRPKVKEQFR